jgi:hypothetical protein
MSRSRFEEGEMYSTVRLPQVTVNTGGRIKGTRQNVWIPERMMLRGRRDRDQEAGSSEWNGNGG